MTSPPTSPPRDRVRLYGDDFAADPDQAYQALREQGPVAWADMAPHTSGLVVTSHQAAIDLLTNTRDYSKDARRWRALTAGHVPADSPALALMAWRPSMLYADGADHARLRSSIDACLSRIPPHRIRETTRTATRQLLARVDHTGQADLVTDVAATVPLLVFADVMGCPEELTGQLVRNVHGLIEAGPGAQKASEDLADLLAGIIDLKARQPGQDLTSWLIAHDANLTVREVIDQLILMIGAGSVPTTAWIIHAIRLLLDEDSYAGSLSAGTLAIHRAMEKALWVRSPMGAFSIHYARQDTTLHGVPIPAGVPILIAHPATNTDPALPNDLAYSSRAHLSWSVGPHRCPATSQAIEIVRTAIETVWDRLWDMRATHTAEEVPNLPGPFHQCPVRLHVAFEPKDPAPTETGGSL